MTPEADAMRAALVALAGTVNDAGILREACRVLVQAPAGWAAPVSAPAPVPATRVPPAKAKPRKDTAVLAPELIDRIKARGEQTSVLAREAGLARSQLAQMLAAPGAKVRKATLRKLQALAASAPVQAAAGSADVGELLELVNARARAVRLPLHADALTDAGAPQSVRDLLAGKPVDQLESDRILAWALQA